MTSQEDASIAASIIIVSPVADMTIEFAAVIATNPVIKGVCVT